MTFWLPLPLYLITIRKEKGKAGTQNVNPLIVEQTDAFEYEGMRMSREYWSDDRDQFLIDAMLSGYTYSEIAKRMGVTRSTISSRVYRLRRKGRLNDIRRRSGRQRSRVQSKKWLMFERDQRPFRSGKSSIHPPKSICFDVAPHTDCSGRAMSILS